MREKRIDYDKIPRAGTSSVLRLPSYEMPNAGATIRQIGRGSPATSMLRPAGHLERPRRCWQTDMSLLRFSTLGTP
jgi:hypothetical protein